MAQSDLYAGVLLKESKKCMAQLRKEGPLSTSRGGAIRVNAESGPLNIGMRSSCRVLPEEWIAVI